MLALFLITNMLTTCMFLLIGLGLVDRLKGFITETSVIVGFSTAMLTVTAYGIGKHWDPADKGLSVRYGAWVSSGPCVHSTHSGREGGILGLLRSEAGAGAGRQHCCCDAALGCALVAAGWRVT